MYGYCIVPRGSTLAEGITGIGGVPVGVHDVDRLAVVVSRIDRPEQTIEHVQDHNRIVEVVVSDEVTPVPLRFGQWFAEVADFEAAIAGRSAGYEQQLARFAGCLEFGIRVIRPDKLTAARDVHVAAATSGFEYMKALQRRLTEERGEKEESERVRGGISEVLGGLVREERVDPLRTPHGVVTVSHLVARADFDRYREATQHLRDLFPDMRFLLSGPWAPYSFAT